MAEKLTIVTVDWGQGFYKQGKCVYEHRDKWEAMSPQKTIELYSDCEVEEVNMYDAEWTSDGNGFPDRLEDALNKDFVTVFDRDTQTNASSKV